ncbi:MAG: hypothetical protein ACI9AD_000189 [Nitriliruptoraceae bacterium]|jgi:hypothetical protein
MQAPVQHDPLRLVYDPIPMWWVARQPTFVGRRVAALVRTPQLQGDVCVKRPAGRPGS